MYYLKQIKVKLEIKGFNPNYKIISHTYHEKSSLCMVKIIASIDSWIEVNSGWGIVDIWDLTIGTAYEF